MVCISFWHLKDTEREKTWSAFKPAWDPAVVRDMPKNVVIFQVYIFFWDILVFLIFMDNFNIPQLHLLNVYLAHWWLREAALQQIHVHAYILDQQSTSLSHQKSDAYQLMNCPPDIFK